jgi:enoyl-CoA hydratase/carnithine racemase
MSTDPSNADVVLFERVGEHIAVATLNRPEKRNAINGAIASALHDIVQMVETDPAIRVAILASSSPKTFCAGADLREVGSAKGRGMVHPESGFAGFVLAKRKKPWIAAVGGIAVAGGSEILCACDMRVCGESAEFGLPEVKRGMVAGAGGVTRLPRQIPRAIALELIATGDRIGARRAYELGFVNRVVPDGQERAEALKLAEAIAVNAPVAVKEALALARQAYDHSDDELTALTVETMKLIMNTKDFQEGPRAFLEKRAPVWTGE